MRKITVTRRWSRFSSRGVPTLLVLTVLPFIASSLAQPSCFYFEGYDTLVGLDADLGDLGRVDGNVSMARVACELVPNCVGFNSKGWLKANLTDWKNDSSVCTYVRQGGRALGACPSFPGYVTRPGEDADGNDFWQQEWDPTAAFAACEINPWCRGFNNKGYMKHKLTDWKADPVLCTYVRSDVGFVAGLSGHGQIGIGASPRNCLTIDPNNGKGFMRECHNYKDDWGNYGQHLFIQDALFYGDEDTIYNSLSRILVPPRIGQSSYFYSGGCLTRYSDQLLRSAVGVSQCLMLGDLNGVPNTASWSQQWMIKPFTVAGMVGFRITTRMSDEYCLQMGDGDDQLHVRRCANDKRQVFAIVGHFCPACYSTIRGLPVGFNFESANFG